MKLSATTLLAGIAAFFLIGCSGDEPDPVDKGDGGGDKPEVVKPDPPVVKPDPPVVKPDPPVVKPDPPVVKPDPEVVPPDPAGEKVDPELIKKDLEALVSAVFRADTGPLEKYTHERVIAIVGDKETFLAEMEKLFGQFKEQGIALVGVEIEDEMDFFEGDVHQFVLVSTTIIMKVGDEEQPPVPGSQLGVRKKTEEGWKYIDCSALTTEMAREWFPDFPKDKEIPAEAEGE